MVEAQSIQKQPIKYYQAHVFDHDARFINGVWLSCAGDAAAVESAKKYADGYDVEIWDDDRKVATIRRAEIKTGPVKLMCRFEMTAADMLSSEKFCLFEFPGCKGCLKAQQAFHTVGSSEDPMKSNAWRGLIANDGHLKRSFFR